MSTISPPRTITTPTEQTDERSLLAVSKSIAAKSFIVLIAILSQNVKYVSNIIVICTLNDVPSKRINSVIKQLYALNAEMSIMVGATKVIPALLPKIQKFRRNKRGKITWISNSPKTEEVFAV